MFRDELDMLQCRLEETRVHPVQHVIVESPVTHRGVAKPLHYTQHAGEFEWWQADQIHHVVTDLPQDSPWAREHAQRNAAWPVIDALAKDGDTVVIGDLDEIPSAALLDWRGPAVAAARMRTTLFAVDWEVPDHLLPPTCVVATVRYLRRRAADGFGLAEVRDRRGDYTVIGDGGWHFSWVGGPERQREKLETATCHTELLGTAEGDLIASGERYRTSQDGGGLPVVPVDVDGTWPAYIRERRCPANWYRPRIVSLRDGGMPQREIAKEVGRNRSTVQAVLSEFRPR